MLPPVAEVVRLRRLAMAGVWWRLTDTNG
jgi:hypothetical protein